MNIGIVEWQNNETEYPLKGAGTLSGLFCDASFVSYDGFIPSLTNIYVAETEIKLSVSLDDGVHIFTFNLPISQGDSVRLRDNNRSYGSLVFGRLTDSVTSGSLGNNISVNCRFDPCTVRSIDSTNGVYSINGLSGDVVIGLDDNLIYNTGSYLGAPSLTAVSSPINIDTVDTSSTQSYIYSNSRQLQSVDTLNGSVSNLALLDKFYKVIYNHSSHLLGVTIDKNTSSIFNLSSIPSAKLLSVPGSITGIASDGSNNLWVLADNTLLNLGTYPYTYSLGNHSTTGVVGCRGLFYSNGKLNVYTDGPRDYSVSSPITYFSNLIYSLDISGGVGTPTLLGSLNDPSITNTVEAPNLSRRIPWMTNIYTLNGSLYGWNLISGFFNLYQINATSLETTRIIHVGYEDASGVANVFVGGTTISLNAVTPLKTINGVAVVSNQINIIGSDTLTITQPAGDTLAFNLPIADGLLNVNRSIAYNTV